MAKLKNQGPLRQFPAVITSNPSGNVKNIMKRIILTAIISGLLVTVSFAQNGKIKGVITDRDDQSILKGVTLTLLLQKDSSLVKSTVSDATGYFEFNQLGVDSFIVTGSSIGYQQFVSFLDINENERDLGIIKMDKQGQDLSAVTIIATAPAVVQKGDTSQFSAGQYKVNPDATTEDLVKKMPGITVDKDGTVTAQGEQVKKITVDGKDFFGDDATAALKNLPAEIVDKIQVFDRLSDQAQLTGVDDGNSQKSINIVTKTGVKNGQFGRIYAGVGTDGRYTGGGNVSFFNGDRRFSVVGNFNNINQQNFGSQDLLGVTSSGSNRGNAGGGGGRGYSGGGRGAGGGSDNFLVGQSNGISKTNALGLNYSDKWGKKLTVSGSYFFNNSTNNNQSVTNTQILDNNQFTAQNSDAFTKNFNHRINARFEYKIDSNNTLFIIPSLNFQNNKNSSYASIRTFRNIQDSINNSRSNAVNDRNGYNLRNNIMYRHSFPKKGRSLSIGFNTAISKNDGESTIDGYYRFYDNLGLPVLPDSVQQQFTDNATNGTTLSGTIAYTEPISKKSMLQFDYNPSIQKNKADQQTFLFDGQKYADFDTTLSNKFDNTITTNNAGITYRYTPDKDEQLSLGVNYQHSKLESNRVFPTVSGVNQTFTNFLPNAMWRKKISNFSNIRLFYRASTNFPSVTQLQDVVSLSNPLRVSSGNPGLKQSYTHLLAGRYTYTNTKTSRSFFANIFLQTAADYISNATYIARADSAIQQGIILKQGSQLSRPANLDGYKSLRTFFTYSMPVKPIKTNINLNAGVSYSKLPGLVNYVPTTTDNIQYNAGVVFASNISQFVDFNVSYNAAINNARTKGGSVSNNNYVNHSIGATLNLLNKKGWFVQNDVSGQIYEGLSGGLDQQFTLWNAALGKKFLKGNKGELKLSVFDILKQNQSVSRTVNNTYIEDVQSQVLQQYFMLTFTYSLKNFGTPKKTTGAERNENMPRGGGF
jgi:hypothetical protein